MYCTHLFSSDFLIVQSVKFQWTWHVQVLHYIFTTSGWEVMSWKKNPPVMPGLVLPVIEFRGTLNRHCMLVQKRHLRLLHCCNLSWHSHLQVCNSQIFDEIFQGWKCPVPKNASFLRLVVVVVVVVLLVVLLVVVVVVVVVVLLFFLFSLTSFRAQSLSLNFKLQNLALGPLTKRSAKGEDSVSADCSSEASKTSTSRSFKIVRTFWAAPRAKTTAPGPKAFLRWVKRQRT